MGDIFGGFLMAEMDLAAAIASRRHCKSRVVTVAVDGLVFKKPVHTGDTISCYTWIKSVGRTSMTELDLQMKVLSCLQSRLFHLPFFLRARQSPFLEGLFWAQFLKEKCLWL